MGLKPGQTPELIDSSMIVYNFESKYNGDNSRLTMELKLGLIHTQKFDTIQVTPHKGLKYNVT